MSQLTTAGLESRFVVTGGSSAQNHGDIHHRGDDRDNTGRVGPDVDLGDWPGERFGHRALLERAWELRATVRSWDALYVALAEALDATLLTLDERLARATGPTCAIDAVAS